MQTSPPRSSSSGAAHLNSQAFLAVLIQHRYEQQRSAVVRPLVHEVVVRPHLIPAILPQPGARTVVQSQPDPPPLTGRHLQTCLAPDPLHALVIDPPAIGPQLPAYSTMAVQSVLLCPRDDRSGQQFLIAGDPGPIPLRYPRPTEDRAARVPDASRSGQTRSRVCRRRVGLTSLASLHPPASRNSGPGRRLASRACRLPARDPPGAVGRPPFCHNSCAIANRSAR